MKNGSELSRTVAIFIVQKILMDDAGLVYICQTYERFYAVTTVLNDMVVQLAESQAIRLIKHVIRCYLRLSDNPRWWAIHDIRLFQMPLVHDIDLFRFIEQEKHFDSAYLMNWEMPPLYKFWRTTLPPRDVWINYWSTSRITELTYYEKGIPSLLTCVYAVIIWFSPYSFEIFFFVSSSTYFQAALHWDRIHSTFLYIKFQHLVL